MSKYILIGFGYLFLLLGFVFWESSGPNYSILMLCSIFSETISIAFFLYVLRLSTLREKIFIYIGIVLGIVQLVFATGLWLELR